MMKQFFSPLLGLLFVCVLSAQAHAEDPFKSYEGRWGARLTTGSGFYGQARFKSVSTALDLGQTIVAGVPYFFQIDGTYAVTNAFEVFAGFRADFSVLQMSLLSRTAAQDLTVNPQSTSNAFGIPYGLALGFRYYFNPQEIVKAYVTHQLLIGLSRAGVGLGAAAGLEWALTNNISVHAEYGGLFAFALTSESNYKIGGEGLLSVGAQYRF